MGILGGVVYWAALILFYLLWARVILDFVRQLRRDWKPQGFWLAVSVAILTVTDPILRVARRVIRPVRVGGAQIDLAMLVVMVLLLVIMVVVPSVLR